MGTHSGMMYLCHVNSMYVWQNMLNIHLQFIHYLSKITYMQLIALLILMQLTLELLLYISLTNRHFSVDVV